MIMSMQLTIVGVKPSKFEVNDYKEDTTKVYALLPLSADEGGMGNACEAFNYKSSLDIQEFKGQSFPITADCKVELITSGKKSRLVLHQVDVKQISKG